MPPIPNRLSTVGADEELAVALATLSSELGLTREFPAAALAEATAAISSLVLPETDRTEIPFVTIDPAGSQDLDQAMWLSRDGSGYRVAYAIADVPAFVLPGGALDAEARRRGQTIYAPDGRIPLHPPMLSEDAASLLPNQLRSAFVWDFTLDGSANVTEFAVARAQVRSREQLTYAGVQATIDSGGASDGSLLLKEIGEKRILLEQQRGGASLSMPETLIERRGDAYELIRRKPVPVENWNAQISLMTGMAAADLMLRNGIGILRTMPPADAQSIAEFRARAAALGHPWPLEQPYGDYLREIDTDDSRQLAIMHAAGSLFRGAGYTAFDGSTPANSLQAAVGAPYAHATAPLRRLVDRFVLGLCDALSAGRAAPDWVRRALPGLPAIMAKSANISGELDRRALDTVEAAILQSRTSETFLATVLSAGKSDGMIQLQEPPVTARCVGQLTVGARIRVRLLDASVQTGVVSFTLDQ